MTLVARLAIALGIVACLMPWLLHAVGLSPHRMHSDLWIGFGALAAAAVIEMTARPTPGRAHRILAGTITMAVAAINAPTLWERAGSVGEVGVDGFLAEAAIQRMVAYAAAAVAGAALVGVGIAMRSRAAPD